MKSLEPKLLPLGDDITLIDLVEGGVQGRTGCYVIDAEQAAIIETGATPGIHNIKAGLEKLSMNPDQVKYVIVTHIHLDHSGGVGSLLPYFPHAKVVVHERGARHLIDPSRLIAGAHAVYGDRLEEMFGEIAPVPEDRVLVRKEGDILELGNGRILTFYDTPGHARHHFSIHDSVSEGIFTGDTVGIRYVKDYSGLDFEPIYPTTTPSEFDKDAVLTSIEKLEKLNPKKIFHGHFGVTEPASYAFNRIRETVVEIDTIARSNYTPGMDPTFLEEKLREYIKQDLIKQGDGAENIDFVEFDLPLNVMGLIYSLDKEYKAKKESNS